MKLLIDKDKLKKFNCPVRPAYGVLLLRDKIDDGTEGGIITDIRSDKDRFKTYNNTCISGVVVEVADNFVSQACGGYSPKVGDRILTTVSASAPINFYGEYDLLLVRESEILATVSPDIIIDTRG